MDEALVQAVLDAGGRPYYRGPVPSSLYDHWMRSFCDASRVTLHLRVLRGTDRHHVVEAAFKALGVALRQALVDTGTVFSTKGAVTLEDGDYSKARDYFTQAYNLNQEHQQWAAASVNQANLATAAIKQGQPAAASQHLTAAEDAARQSRSSQALGRVYLQWASFYLDQNDPAAAQEFLNRAQPLATTPELKGTLNHHRGRLALARGDTGQALDMFTQALTIDRSVLDRAAMAADLFSLGEVYRTRGELAESWDYYVRAFDVYAGLGKKAQLPKCLKRLQEVNQQGQMGHSLERFEKLANPNPP